MDAGITSINGSKKLASTVLDDAGNPMLKYFVLEYDGIADIYNIAFPKGSDLLPVIDAALQEMIDSGEMQALITVLPVREPVQIDLLRSGKIGFFRYHGGKLMLLDGNAELYHLSRLHIGAGAHNQACVFG